MAYGKTVTICNTIAMNEILTDMERLREAARNRGSQLRAAGLCPVYAVGLDGSPCVVADVVGVDVPALTCWRTWVVRGNELSSSTHGRPGTWSRSTTGRAG